MFVRQVQSQIHSSNEQFNMRYVATTNNYEQYI